MVRTKKNLIKRSYKKNTRKRSYRKRYLSKRKRKYRKTRKRGGMRFERPAWSRGLLSILEKGTGGVNDPAEKAAEKAAEKKTRSRIEEAKKTDKEAKAAEKEAKANCCEVLKNRLDAIDERVRSIIETTHKPSHSRKSASLLAPMRLSEELSVSDPRHSRLLRASSQLAPISAKGPPLANVEAQPDTPDDAAQSARRRLSRGWL